MWLSHLLGETTSEIVRETAGGCMAGIFLLTIYYWIKGFLKNMNMDIFKEHTVVGLIFLVFAFPISIIIVLFLRENLLGPHYNGMLLGFTEGALTIKLLLHRTKKSPKKIHYHKI